MLFLLTGFTPHQNLPTFPETLQKVNKHTFCQHVCGECVSVTSSTSFINGRRSFICASSLLSSPFECQVSPTPQLTSDPTDPLSFSIFTITIVFTSMMHPPVLLLSRSLSLSLPPSFFLTQPAISRRVPPIRVWSCSRFLPVKGRCSFCCLFGRQASLDCEAMWLKPTWNSRSIYFLSHSVSTQDGNGWLVGWQRRNVWLRQTTNSRLPLISPLWGLYWQLRKPCEESRSEDNGSRELRQRLIVEKTPECLHKCFPIPALGQPIGAQHLPLLPNPHLEVIMSTLPSANAVTEAGRAWLIITLRIMDAGLRRAAGGAGPTGRDN